MLVRLIGLIMNFGKEAILVHRGNEVIILRTFTPFIADRHSSKLAAAR